MPLQAVVDGPCGGYSSLNELLAREGFTMGNSGATQMYYDSGEAFAVSTTEIATLGTTLGIIAGGAVTRASFLTAVRVSARGECVLGMGQTQNAAQILH